MWEITINITSTLAVRAQLCPDFACIRTKETVFTWREWEQITQRCAGWLLEKGKPGSLLAVTAVNRWETLALFCGAARAGWIFLPLDARLSESEKTERLRLAGPDAVINQTDLSSTGRQILQTDPANSCHKGSDALFYSGFTSGSSGTPKQFARSHRSWICSFQAGTADFRLTGKETAVIAGPLHHSLFLYEAAFALYSGQETVLIEKFQPHPVAAVLKESNAFVFYAVPTMLESLQKQTVLQGSGHVFFSGAGWPAEQKQKWLSLYPAMPLFEFYGASELSFVSFMTPEDIKKRPSSSGRASTGVSIEIRSGNTPLPPLKSGTIWVKSPMMFSGYAQNGSFKANIGADGFYTVGDAGFLDQDGYLFVTGREEFMIITGGVNVYPEEVERVIAEQPEVEAVAVTSIKDRHLGEKIVCLYKGNIDPRQLRKQIKQKLSVEKRPRIWRKVADLPYTSNGKMARSQLKQLAKEIIEN